MPFSTIDRSSDYFRIKLYTGNGSTQSITFDESKAMQPDCTWIKVRNDANVTLVHDVIRGATKEIYTPLTNAEATDANGLTAFNSNGFSVGSAFGVNRSGYNFVNWSWKANGTGVSNTQGTLTATVSANTTSGFSICRITEASSYSGVQTFGHGLGVAPSMVIYRQQNIGSNWQVYHKSTGTNLMQLNTTGAVVTSATFWPTVTSTLFGLSENVQAPTYTSIAYCFAEVKGYSKAFSYTGNGSADGTYVNLGFRPAWLLIKRTDSAGYDWLVYDNKRQVEYNVVDDFLKPNLSDAETTGNAGQSLDFLSNGIKFRGTGASSNASGGTYIGFAIAQNPFVSSKGIVANAR